MSNEFNLQNRKFLTRIDTVIWTALEEDIGSGDVTTEAIIPADVKLSGQFIAKKEGVTAGLLVAKRVFQLLDPDLEFKVQIEEGTWVQEGQVLATVQARGQALLKGERVALNFMQRMSGIATQTRQFVDAIKGTKAKILDTRKTVPGLRILDKWAVRIGGGENHRFGLFDMVLIKENHIAVAGSITEAVRRARQHVGETFPIEVEVKNMEELREALQLPINRILLDNMTISELREAVEIAAGAIPLEASGNISMENVGEVARTGVDYISVGKLTHSVEALDISFLIRS